MKPNIGISPKNIESLVAILSTTLANEVILYMKTRKFHWNVSGESFIELHKFFEEQYIEIEEVIDEVAERIIKIGGKVIGTTKEFTKLSIVKEFPGEYPNPKEMIKELLNDHELIIKQLRDYIEVCSEKLKDAGTTDLLTKLIQIHETIAWKLRRYLS